MMVKNTVRQIVLGILLSLPVIVNAADIELDKIVVTPSRIEEFSTDTGRSVDVISSSQINESSSQDLAGALTELTSVNIGNYGGPGTSKTIRMRGSTGAQVLVLMDGRPLNNPRDGEVDLSNIALDNISRVEVMHGPGSSLYGSSAMGGVVNIITRKPPKEGQKTELYSSFGTARTYNERMSNGARISKFGYLISAGYQSSQGFRQNSQLNAEDSNLKLEYGPNDENNLSFNSGFYKSKLGSPGPESSPDSDDKQNSLKRFFDFNWGFKPDTKTALAAKVYQNYERLEFLENTAGSIFDVANKKDIHTTVVRGVDVQFDKQLFDAYTLLCGFNYVNNQNDSTSSGKHKYGVAAGYLENHLDFLDKKLNVNLSARLDDYSNFGTEINPSLGLYYKINEDLKLHGLISRSFRAPTFNDLYWPDEGWIKGNSSLKPEKGITTEAGIESSANKYIHCALNYFHNEYKQLIQWSDNGSGVWQPMNVSSAVINGIESKNNIYISDNLDLNVNYTFMIAKDDKTRKYLVYQPQNKVDASIRYHDPSGLIMELRGEFTGHRFNDAANNTKVKNFFVFSFNVSKRLRQGLTCFGSIDNLFDRRYQVIHDYPMPGFSITGGFKAEF